MKKLIFKREVLKVETCIINTKGGLLCTCILVVLLVSIKVQCYIIIEKCF